MAETVNQDEVSFLMKKVSDGKEVVFNFNQFMQELMKRLAGSDSINDEIIINKEPLRISTLQLFDGNADLKLSLVGNGEVRVVNSKESVPGTYKVAYQQEATLIPDESSAQFLRWEGDNAAQVQVLEGGINTLLMDSMEKKLVAVFDTAVEQKV